MLVQSDTLAPDLTSGRLLARNTLWNLFGQVAPAAVAIVSIPLLVKGIGVDRFGVLSLAWVVIGYFSLFDLGLGRTLTKMVAEKLGGDQAEDIAPLTWTSLALMIALGVVGSMVMVFARPLLVDHVLKIPPGLRSETRNVFLWLAISVPIVTATSGLRGVLEAQQRFGILSGIRVPMGVFSFAAPLAVLPFSHSLVPIVIVLVIGRTLAAFGHLWACFHYTPSLRNVMLRPSLALPVLRFGGWMTISNIANPLLMYLDLFFIGVLLSVTAVAYYATPWEIITKFQIIPGALAGVLFPAFAMSFVQNRERSSLLLSRGIKYVYLVLFPLMLVLVSFAPEILNLWLGPAFAAHGTPVLRWLAAGVFVNCLAQIAFGFIQGAGYPDFTAKLHVIELPVFVGVLWVMTRHFGIQGAAIAWSARAVADAAVLLVMSHHLVGEVPRLFSVTFASIAGALTAFYVASSPQGLISRALLCAVFLVVFAAASWYVALSTTERNLVLRAIAASTFSAKTL